MVGECISNDDVLAEQIANAVHTFLLHAVAIERMILITENPEKTLPAGHGIVGQQLNAIDAAHSQNGILFIFQLSVLPLLHKVATYP